MSRGFVESTATGFARAITRAMLSEETAHRRGLVQALDPRVRVVGLLSLVVAVTLCRRLTAVAALFLLATALALLSKIDLMTLAKRVWLAVFAFTGVIALPAIFLTPGNPVGQAGGWQITEQGLRAAGLLVVRVEAAVTFTTVLVLCTRWPQVLKAMRSLLLPKEAVAMLAMTYRYVFLVVETAMQMFESRRSRTVGVLPGPERRRMAARTAGVLLSKSVALSDEVYQAMQSRGFRGDVRILSELHLTMWDYIALLLFWMTAALAVWKGR
jgi:cobalt/nickel transport system permease protein